jgi:methionyl-tRNA formyltransferase
MALRIVLMGTGHFALPAFRAVIESRHTVVGLFTQPDRAGRGHHHHVNPLKELVAAREIPVFQPDKVNLPDPIAHLRALSADVCVVAAYGQILSAELLRTPRLGAVNVHASLLPKYRGAAPIQTAILSGESETGVTIFRIEPKLDAGPILAIEKTPIGPKETSGELEVRLAEIGASLIVPVLDQMEKGAATPLIQDSSQVSRAPRLKKEDGRIDWNQSAAQIDCRVRAFQPWPLAYSTLLTARGNGMPAESQRLILLDVDPSAAASAEGIELAPGAVLTSERKRLIVQAGDGKLEILRLRPEGKRAMSASEFLAGHPLSEGDHFDAAGVAG